MRDKTLEHKLLTMLCPPPPNHHCSFCFCALHFLQVPNPRYLKAPKTCAVVGAPMSFGQPYEGVQKGPSALRDAGLLDGIMKLGWRVSERGDLDFEGPAMEAPEYHGPGNAKLADAVGRANERIYKATRESAGGQR